jgi:hypothetical protein
VTRGRHALDQAVLGEQVELALHIGLMAAHRRGDLGARHGLAMPAQNLPDRQRRRVAQQRHHARLLQVERDAVAA